MGKDIKDVIITGEKMKERVKELGALISERYKGKKLLLIGVLKGSVIFFADLIREITIPVEIDFISASSYGKSTVSSGVVTLKKDVGCSVSGKNILIVEDIIDTGFTLKYIKDIFEARSAESVSICCALDKPSRRDENVNIEVDYIGFQIPDEFVVGYGLDYDEEYRNLPDVCVLSPEVYTK
ncbi:MAG: hypoxanthine phosphoribosyltransferase [Deltaproteobacteria bacterium]